MHLTLIRHAESNHVQAGMISAEKSCTGLTPNGLLQAQRLCDRFRVSGECLGSQVLLTSPVRRAVQTAELIAEALPGLVPILDPDLVKLRPGDSDGLSHVEFKRRYGDFNPAQDPDRPFPPNGETWSCFIERTYATLERIARQYAGKNVLAVTHAGFIVAAFMVLFQLPQTGSHAWINPVNTSLTEWENLDGRWRLIKYNDAWHLPQPCAEMG